MTPLEELIGKAIDGELSDTEQQELDSVLDDPAAWDQFVKSMDCESLLRGLDDEFDVTDTTMRKIRGLSQQRQPDGQVSRNSQSRWRTRRTILGSIGAIAVLAIIAGIRLLWSPPRTEVEQTSIATLEDVLGDVTVVRDGSTLPPETPLRGSDRLRVGPEGKVTLKYDDGTSFRLFEKTTIELQPMKLNMEPEQNSVGKSVHVARGRIAANVRPQLATQPLVVTTPHAETKVIGTELSVSVNNRETVVAVQSGKVRVNRVGEESSLLLTGGNFALMSDNEKQLESSPFRTSDGLVAYYPFDETAGNVIHDRSNYESPLDLHLFNGSHLRWTSDVGVVLPGGSVLASKTPATKIMNACGASHEITIEAWITPMKTAQAGPARIVTMSQESSKVNFMLGHGGYGVSPPQKTFVARLRTTRSKRSGFPRLETKSNTIKPRLMHVVVTRDSNGRRAFYLDGELNSQDTLQGDFSTWVDNLPLALGNELNGEVRPWEGGFSMVAIYARALSSADITRNFSAGLTGVRLQGLP